MEYRLFDERYYLSQAHRVDGNPLQHFLSIGWRSNLRPHPLFDTQRYREWYPDVEASGIDPLTHFERSGKDGFKPHLLFNSMVYLSEHPDAAEKNPLVHYLEDGWRRNYDPHQYFDTGFYLRTNHDVCATGVNPLVHYVQFGHKEGRKPHPLFDGEQYRRDNNLNSETNPLEHFLKDGIKPLSTAYNYMTSDEFKALCREHAARWNVVPDVHPQDMTMGYAVYHPDFAKDRSLAVRYYFDDGRNSAQRLLALVKKDTFSLLEFASGYGRVARHWRHVTNARISTCDIHPAAVHFSKDALRVDAYQSSTEPEALDVPSHDVIFCLSFFSHMPDRTFGRWLKSLYGKLNEHGLLIFTTHGETCMAIRKLNVPAGTLYWREETEQHDLSTKDYGYAAVDRVYVEKQIAQIPGAKLIRFEKDYYWKLQDTYVVQRT